MFKKRIVVLCVFISAIAIILLFPLTNCNQYEKAAYHSFLKTQEFQKQTRQEQILKCASCHKQEYENEMKGPHANAMVSLNEHAAFVNSDKYDCVPYTDVVNRSFNHCVGCHAPENMYETLLKDSLHQPLLFAEGLLKLNHPKPLSRVSGNRATSIDCMGCHYDGKELLSLKHIPSPDDSVVSKQTLAKITVNNMNCYLCHFDAVHTFDPGIAIKRTGSALCINCHQEYDADKKGTHYFFWQHDSLNKKNPKPALVLDDFHFSLNSNGKVVDVIWQNTIMPHKISPGPEMVLYCDILSADSAVLGSKTIRINKKTEFDKEMYKQLGGRNHRGVAGQDVPLDGSAIKYEIELKKAGKPVFYRISSVHKSQYWFPDSLGNVSLVKTYVLK